MNTMVLTTTVEHDGTDFEIDLDALDRFGSYYVDRERGPIIHASVYTHGTPDSRHLRGDVICGTDYTFETIEVEREQVREYIRDELDVEISDETLDTAIAEYQAAGIEVAGDFNASLDRYPQQGYVWNRLNGHNGPVGRMGTDIRGARRPS